MLLYYWVLNKLFSELMFHYMFHMIQFKQNSKLLLILLNHFICTFNSFAVLMLVAKVINVSHFKTR